MLDTIDKYGKIFWMDFSENLSGTPKWEHQDSHFAKSQYSLHCTVCHHTGYDYLYHISDDLTHDSHFLL